MVFIVMGVSGSGKSTLAKALADSMGGKYYDGDDFHPPENIAKMSAGIGLQDEDRFAWLHSLKDLAKKSYETNQYTYIACSALKDKYRTILKEAVVPMKFLFLEGNKKIIIERLRARADDGEHFMPTSLLESQFDDLEAPVDVEEVIFLNIELSIVELVKKVKAII